MITTLRLGALAAVGALAVGSLASCGSNGSEGGGSGSGGSATAKSSTPAYDLATQSKVVDWLESQLKGGLAYNRQYQFDDYSLSTDIALGLDAVEADAQVPTIASAVAKNLKAYVSPGYGTVTSAGSAAKALVLEQTAGAQSLSSLQKTVEGTVTSRGPSAGRIADKLDPKNKKAADYSNTIGQAYAVEGLTTAGSEMAPAVTAFLLDQQCSQGWFRLYFTADPEAKDQTCDADKSSTPDVDVTAYAVLALAGLENPTPEVKKSLDAAVSWLVSQQAGDGSFNSAKPKVANADSTGLAGWALGTVDQTSAAEKAATWVGNHVVTCGKAAGAIAYDDTALAQVTTKGITKTTEGQFRLATAQALPVLSWLPTGVVAGESC